MRLDTSFLVGVWLEAVVYGVYVVAFLVCLRLFRTHAPVVGRALPIWLGALFVLATAHCALSLSAALDAFVRYTELRGPRPTPYPSPSPTPGVRPPTQIPPTNPTHTPGPYGFHDPTRYISNRALPTNLASLGVYTGVVFLSSLMLVYRLLVMYRYKFIWIVGPGLLVIGSFIISIIVVWKYAHIDLNLPGAALQAQLEAIDPWVPPVYAIAFLSNLSISALMMVKTSFRSKVKVTPAFRRSHQHNVSGDYIFDIDERTGPIPSPVPRRNTISSRWVIIAGLVESGTLAPVFMLIALILCTLLVPMLAPIAALAPTMQIIQLQLGLDSTARTRPSSVHDRPVGRSPYLVPAPRYHDSSDESDVEGGKHRSVSHSRTPSNSTNPRSTSGSSGNRPTDGRRFSARGMWAWRGHSNSNSQSSSSAREAPAVMVQMREMTGSAERTAKPDDDVWERIKLDEKPPERPAPSPDRLDESATNRNSDPPPLNRRSTLRKSGGIVKNMISKPTPIAADFPPTTATLPSTVLPNFTIDTETGVTPNLATGTGAAAGEGLARARTLSEHKYHYRVRPREKTASSLAAYLSAQALEQSHPDGRGASASMPSTGQVHQQSTGPHQLSSGQGHQPSQGQHPQSGQPAHQGQQQMTFPMPPSMNYQPASSSGHLPPTIISTVPTSPASGFTSLNPASRNPFRYDPSTPYSDLQREAPSETNMLGIGLSGAQRTPLTVPYTLDPDLVPRWGAVPGAPRIVGLDTFFPPSRGRGWSDGTSQRDVSPAPGLQQDYARAREEVLRQMQRERGAMSDDESVYSSQVLNRR